MKYRSHWKQHSVQWISDFFHTYIELLSPSLIFNPFYSPWYFHWNHHWNHGETHGSPRRHRRGEAPRSGAALWGTRCSGAPRVTKNGGFIGWMGISMMYNVIYIYIYTYTYHGITMYNKYVDILQDWDLLLIVAIFGTSTSSRQSMGWIWAKSRWQPTVIEAKPWEAWRGR